MTTDRIERHIDIAAPAEKVWKLIHEPGWFINAGEIAERQIDWDAGLAIVHDPTYGRFVLRVVELDEPRYAAFRWYLDADSPEGSSTFVEFWIQPTDGGVRLSVSETGFDALDEPETQRRARFDDHSEGWSQELGLAQRHLAGAPADA